MVGFSEDRESSERVEKVAFTVSAGISSAGKTISLPLDNWFCVHLATDDFCLSFREMLEIELSVKHVMPDLMGDREAVPAGSFSIDD